MQHLRPFLFVNYLWNQSCTVRHERWLFLPQVRSCFIETAMRVELFKKCPGKGHTVLVEEDAMLCSGQYSKRQ